MPSDHNHYRATLLLVGLFCFSPLFLMCPDSNMVMAQTLDARKVEGNLLLKQGVQQAQISDYLGAIQLWERALAIYQEVKDNNGEASVLNKLGIAYRSLSQYDKAINYYTQALLIYQTIQDRNGEASVLNNLGAAYIFLSQYNRAIRYFNQALPLFQAAKDRNNEAGALMNLGTAYLSLSQYDKAISYYTQALPIFHTLQDHNGKSKALTNLGNAYNSLSQYSKAIDYYTQALPIFQAVQDHNSEAGVLMNLGVAYDALSHYDRAISYYTQALVIYQAVKNRDDEAKALTNLGDTYGSLSQYSKAIDYYIQALSIFQTVQDRNSEAGLLVSLGGAYSALLQYSRAVNYYTKALPIFQTVQDRNGEAKALNSLGAVYSSLSQYNKAISYSTQALLIYQAIKNRRGEANALTNLGNAYSSLSHYDKAILFNQQALLIEQNVGNRRGQGINLNNIGLALLETGQVTAAEITLFRAIEIWESLRPGLSDNSKVSLFETQKVTYQLLQTALMMQNKTEPALAVAERGRARAFAELLARWQQDKPNPTDTSLIKPLKLEGIRQIAQAQKVTLIEYSILSKQIEEKGKKEWSDTILAIWVIAPNGQVTTRKVDLTPLKISLADLVTNSRDALGIRAFPQRATLIVKVPEGSQKQATENQKQRLQKLHQLLIEPIADLLPKNENDRVIFIPQGSLFLVPFPALQDANGKYLIEKHTILTAPSIQVLDQTHQLQQQRQSNPVAETLVVGNPSMPIVTPYPGEPPQQLNPLPGAEAEANAIAPLLKTQALTGTQGTKAAIKQKMPNARIIHLATHGLLDDLRGLGSAIALAPDHPGTPNDGLLTAEEILDLKLSANLVVLSACDTGRGRITGDGVIGLSRSFISAGVPSIIVSLWAVPDAPTAELMTEFYTNWQVKKLDKAQALRQAMLTTMTTHPNPRDWAAFTLIGEAE